MSVYKIKEAWTPRPGVNVNGEVVMSNRTPVTATLNIQIKVRLPASERNNLVEELSALVGRYTLGKEGEE